ncbi:baseplate J-like protein [Leptospira langatensis]|uniref:Baseplate J-like protein n=1 Tax=Leptospira langatensis TaxID=2484983 RepID=A0A5F1ZZH6_9LEPT|nr:baseplate J/gp47 family protein [Leptospira langatensis]TGK04170.1 baseplate J-like protein [Leptospira langatensis]TGL43650.1 baseplate J-like protein [Leptospira langatensis]
MAFGVTPQGFIRKSYSDILQALEDRAKLEENFGPEIDLSPYGELGIILQNVAKEFDEVWQGLEETYYSKFINQAEGVQLDRVVAQGGLSRIPAQRSAVDIRVTGETNTVVPQGFLVQTAQGIQFGLSRDTTLTVSTGQLLPFTSINSGSETVVPAGSITEIVVPLSGVDSVSNPFPSIGGAPVESDAELRQRYKDRSTFGGSSVPAIRESILQVEFVSAVTVYENVTSAVDPDGRPAHSIEIIVAGTPSGSTSQDEYDRNIATAIFNSKPAGIQTYAAEGPNKKSKDILDANGQPHTMLWSVPTAVEIYIKVLITKNTDWVTTNEQLIQTRVIQVIGGVDTIGSVSTEYPGLDVGADVFGWQIIANFDGIKGIDDVVINLGIAPNPTSTAKVSINASEFAQTFNSLIQVIAT